ncbi:hypothetical protein HK102_005140 [Quaeritorhiza haematococci]|nr:hypothetical protein HK102_005140 [Quaeritorhiza haematococci]
MVLNSSVVKAAAAAFLLTAVLWRLTKPAPHPKPRTPKSSKKLKKKKSARDLGSARNVADAGPSDTAKQQVESSVPQTSLEELQEALEAAVAVKETTTTVTMEVEATQREVIEVITAAPSPKGEEEQQQRAEEPARRTPDWLPEYLLDEFCYYYMHVDYSVERGFDCLRFPILITPIESGVSRAPAVVEDKKEQKEEVSEKPVGSQQKDAVVQQEETPQLVAAFFEAEETPYYGYVDTSVERSFDFFNFPSSSQSTTTSNPSVAAVKAESVPAPTQVATPVPVKAQESAAKASTESYLSVDEFNCYEYVSADVEGPFTFLGMPSPTAAQTGAQAAQTLDSTTSCDSTDSAEKSSSVGTGSCCESNRQQPALTPAIQTSSISSTSTPAPETTPATVAGSEESAEHAMPSQKDLPSVDSAIALTDDSAPSCEEPTQAVAADESDSTAVSEPQDIVESSESSPAAKQVPTLDTSPSTLDAPNSADSTSTHDDTPASPADSIHSGHSVIITGVRESRSSPQLTETATIPATPPMLKLDSAVSVPTPPTTPPTSGSVSPLKASAPEFVPGGEGEDEGNADSASGNGAASVLFPLGKETTSFNVFAAEFVPSGMYSCLFSYLFFIFQLVIEMIAQRHTYTQLI